MSLRVSTVVLDLNGLRICENFDPYIVNRNRQGFFASHSGTCTVPDFYTVIAQVTQKDNSDVVVIATMNEAKSNSYFHREFLPNNLSSLGYTYVDSKTGFGVLTISIYVRVSLAILTLETKKIYDTIKSASATYRDDHKCFAMYLSLREYGTYAFLLFSIAQGDSRELSRAKLDPYIRRNAVMSISTFVNSSIEILARDPTLKGIPISSAIILGDLGYRSSVFQNNTIFDVDTIVRNLQSGDKPGTIKNLYEHADELRLMSRSGLLYPIQEGLDNKGPSFAPTCDFRVGRDNNCTQDCYSTGENTPLPPSWCIRSCYLQFTKKKISCISYDSIRSGTIIISGAKEGAIATYLISSSEV